jgi:hypothetical protein
VISETRYRPQLVDEYSGRRPQLRAVMEFRPNRVVTVVPVLGATGGCLEELG